MLLTFRIPVLIQTTMSLRRSRWTCARIIPQKFSNNIVAGAGISLGVVPRPTLLVAEPEPNQALSVRKLVLETAKYNVLTAHSTQEALDLFGLFPNVNAVVLVRGGKLNCERVAAHIKTVNQKIPLLGIRCSGIDYPLDSYDPEQLLHILRELLGDPREMEP